jgi:hypothetical protein
MNSVVKTLERPNINQIKLYATLILMSFLSVKALATEATEFGSPEDLVAEIEAAVLEDAVLESWMISPFEAAVAETEGVSFSPSTEPILEPELMIENWMIEPFAVTIQEDSPESDADNN